MSFKYSKVNGVDMFSSTPICHQVLRGHSRWHPLILLDLLLLIFVCIIFFNESDRLSASNHLSWSGEEYMVSCGLWPLVN